MLGPSGPRSRAGRVGCVLVGGAFLACGNAGEDRVLAIEATGALSGFVYFDLNGDRKLGPQEPTLQGIGVRLVLRGTSDTVARTSTGLSGQYAFAAVPVGEYLLLLDSATLGDSARVVGIEVGEVLAVAEGAGSVLPIRLGAGDDVAVVFSVSFPKLSIAEARRHPEGRKVFIEAVALNGAGLFGDTTIHARDASAAMRLTRAGRVVAAAGDSLRFLGIRSVRAGQPTLDDVTAFFLGTPGLPPPTVVSTAGAATAQSGSLDAAQVQVREAMITDTATAGQDYRLDVDDGSGVLEVLLDGDAPLTTPGPYVPGAVVDVTGLLVPTGAGGWRLKPRSDSDLVVR